MKFNKIRKCLGRLKQKKIAASIFLAIIMVISGCADVDNKPEDAVSTSTILKELSECLPKECLVEAEELDFYKELYKMEHRSSDDEIAEDVLLDFIAHYYAEFYLANYYELLEEVSFAALKEQWEAENASRLQMKQNGEVFYGPVEYKFMDYFGYFYSNLKLKNIESLVVHADEELLAAGRTYYEEHSDSYDDLIGAVCLLSDGERSEEKVFSYDDIQSLYKTNEAVLDFIMNSEAGDTMQYQHQERTITVELISKEIDHREFEEMSDVIMNDYVQREFYDDFIAEIAASLKLVLDSGSDR